jgi:hypothetical protein
MSEYGYVVSVVADDKVLIDATVEDSSGFGEGLVYLLRGDVAPPFSLRRGNDLTLPEKANAHSVQTAYILRAIFIVDDSPHFREEVFSAAR